MSYRFNIPGVCIRCLFAASTWEHASHWLFGALVPRLPRGLGKIKIRMMKIFVDLLGWSGALLLLGAYACVSFRKLRPDGAFYQFINGLGSCFLVVNTVYHRAFPSAFVNMIWICIAVWAGIRMRGRPCDAVHVDG